MRMKVSRWEVDVWHTVLGHIFRPDSFSFFPYKIFMIEKNGTYLDCFYPLPCHHIFGGPSILGATIREVWPYEAWKALKNGMAWVARHHKPLDLWLSHPTPHHVVHHTAVTLLPFRDHCLVFVKDFNHDGYPLMAFDPHNRSVQLLQSQLWPAQPPLHRPWPQRGGG